MCRWKKISVMKEMMEVKIYVNENDSRAVIFPLFGKYFCFSSDESALDLAVSMIHYKSSSDFNFTYGNYLNSQEDTAIIELEAA